MRGWAAAGVRGRGGTTGFPPEASAQGAEPFKVKSHTFVPHLSFSNPWQPVSPWSPSSLPLYSLQERPPHHPPHPLSQAPTFPSSRPGTPSPRGPGRSSWRPVLPGRSSAVWSCAPAAAEPSCAPGGGAGPPGAAPARTWGGAAAHLPPPTPAPQPAQLPGGAAVGAWQRWGPART